MLMGELKSLDSLIRISFSNFFLATLFSIKFFSRTFFFYFVFDAVGFCATTLAGLIFLIFLLLAQMAMDEELTDNLSAKSI